MNGEDEEDARFRSIHEECRISASQELHLQNCPFAHESDAFLDDSDEDLTPWTSTHTQLDRVIMVSPPPESPKDNEIFQTPPEGSIIDSSQEKEAPAAAAPVDSIPDRRIEGGDVYVDSMAEEEEEEDLCAEAAVNLVRDSDNLGFTSVKLTQVSNNVSIDPGSKPLEIETIIINHQEEEKEVLYVDSPKTVRKTNGSLLGEGSSMATDDFDRFKYVSSSVVSRKRKEVCCAGTSNGDVRRQEDADADADAPAASNGDGRGHDRDDAPVNRNEILKALLEALQMVTGKTNDDDEDEEVNLMETAKRRGIVFPRPRWWRPPAEGTHD